MGRLSEAIAAAAREAGAELRTDAPVASIDVEQGRVSGVTLEDGSTLEAATVVSGADPHRTLLGLLGREHLPDGMVRELECLDFRSPCVKINLALDRLPRFRGAAGDAAGPEHVGTIHVGASSLDALDAAFEAARRGLLPDRPLIELTLPSAVDGTLSPPGEARGVDVRSVRPLRAGGVELGRRARPLRRPRLRAGGRSRARLLAERPPPRGARPARPRTDLRAHRRQHLPRRDVARPPAVHATAARLGALSHADRGPLPLRRRHAPRRWRHGRVRAQRRSGEVLRDLAR